MQQVKVSLKVVWMSNSRIRLEFKGSSLKQEDKAACTPFYELDSWPWDLDIDSALGGCLFRGVKLTKDVDPDKYSYSGDGIGFYTRG